MSTILTIDKGWEFTQTPSKYFEDVQEKWNECASFPTCVHVELQKAGKIPDPFQELNEWDVQWIGEADWKFRSTFVIDEVGTNADLVLEGVDTYCDVSLNGVALGQTDNMFISHRLPCRAQLRVGSNDLQLRFRSAWLEAKARQHDNAGPDTCWNGDACRMYSRKAQYHWGWDWGPKFISVGPWRPIRLEMYEYRFIDIRVDADLVGPQFTSGTLRARASVSLASDNGSVRYSLVRGDAVIKEEEVGLDVGVDWELPQEIEAWWPIGYGKQPMYELKTQLLDQNGTQLASQTTKVAFRHVNVIQAPLDGQDGTSFYFEVNGVPIFCGGSSWIPADSFLTSITPERYRAWIRLMAEGNQNMLRIWGGGVYEDEALYDACDEFGILVWQDFMFACGLYPAYSTFNDNVKAEAEQVVKRLRNHPCVVLFAGNNEDYAVAEISGVIDYSDESGHYENTGFPARYIYEILLPQVVKENSNIFYWRSSPYGGKSTADTTVGDIHQWNVWHGTQEPWSNWDQLAGRFVSEFGMQGYPDARTIDQWTNRKDQLYPQSKISVQHNKATGFERRIETYLVENFRHTFDMPGYTYITQLMQAECLAAAYRVWRRNWKGPGKGYTSGALVWQLNDCWPCVSWAIADYYLRPKPAFFAISRELRPIVVSMSRKTSEKPLDDLTDSFIEIHDNLQLWACNSTLSTRAVQVELQSWDLKDGLLDRRTFDVSLLPNQSTEVWAGDVPGQPIRTSRAESPRPIVVHAIVRDGQDLIARYSNWPEPYKYLHLPDPSLEIKVNGEEVTLTCATPAKGIILDVDGDAVQWSDQAIDLFPGDPQVVTAKGLAGRDVKVKYLQDV